MKKRAKKSRKIGYNFLMISLVVLSILILMRVGLMIYDEKIVEDEESGLRSIKDLGGGIFVEEFGEVIFYFIIVIIVIIIFLIIWLLIAERNRSNIKIKSGFGISE